MNTNTTPANVPTAIVTANTDKKARRTRKKDIPSIVPAPVVAPVVAPPAPLSVEETAIVEAAKLNISVIMLANRFAAAQSAATAVLDEFSAMVGIVEPKDENGYSTEEIKEISDKIYQFIPCWPMANRGKPVTCSAVLSKNGKWAKNGDFYTKEDAALCVRVPVNVVRMVNATIKRLYRAKPETVDVTVYEIPEMKFNRLLSLIVRLPADEQKLFADALNTVEKKTVKKKDVPVSIDDII